MSRRHGCGMVVLGVLAGLGMLTAAGGAGAATCPVGAVTFTGGASGSWFTASNWSGNQVPGVTTHVCIDTTSTVHVDGDDGTADAEAASVTIVHPDAVLRVRATAQGEGRLGVSGDVTVAGTVELAANFPAAGVRASHLDVGGTFTTTATGSITTTGSTGGGAGVRSVLAAATIHNAGSMGFAHQSVLDAPVVTSSGSISTAANQTLAVRSTAGGPDVTITGPITFPSTIANPGNWVQDGGTLDLTGAMLTHGRYTLDGVAAILAHQAGSTAPSFLVTSGSVHLDSDVSEVVLEFRDDDNTLTGGQVGAAHEVLLRAIVGGSTNVSVPTGLDVIGDITMVGGGGTGPINLIVAGDLTNSGVIRSGSVNYAVVADTITSPGALALGALTLDAPVVTISGSVSGPGLAATLRARSTSGAGPDVTISGSVVMPGSSARYEQTGGTLVAAGGSLQLGAGVWLTDVAIQAEGALSSRLDLHGTSVLAPGSSPGVLEVGTLYRHLSGGTTLEIELGGSEPGSGYDRVSAGGAATLAGTLAVSLVDGFTPAPCDVFDVITSAARSGTFTTVTGTALGGGLELVPAYRSTGLRLIAGTSAGELQVFPTDLEVQRTAPSDTYAVCLAGPPQVSSITIVPSSDGAVTIEPSQLTFTPANWQEPQVVTVTGVYGDQPGGDRSATITHTASGSGQFDLTTDATVEVALLDTGPGPDPTPDLAADVSVAVSTPHAVVDVGQLVRYDLAVANAGPDAASGAVVTHSLPGQVMFSDASPGCVHAGGAVTCEVGDLASGATALVRVVATATTPGAAFASASVTATTEDPQPQNNTASVTTTISLPDDPTERISGVTRIETAVRASETTFDDGEANVVLLARADAFPDALAGSPLAVALGGPLLLTDRTGLHPATAAEIDRVLAAGGAVHLLGGTAALSDDVDAAVGALGHPTVRHAGPDRFATAVAIAEAVPDPAFVFVATGLDFPDALAAGTAAAGHGGVIVLTAGEAVPDSTRVFLDARPDLEVHAAGGPASRALPEAAAHAGADRYATAVAIAEAFFADPTSVGLATGSGFADALSGAGHLGRRGAPMLLSDPSALPAPVGDYLATRPRLAVAFLFGGRAALSDDVEAAIAAALAR